MYNILRPILPYFLEISSRQDFISSPCLMRWQFKGEIYRNWHACMYTALIMSLFVYTYNVLVWLIKMIYNIVLGSVSLSQVLLQLVLASCFLADSTILALPLWDASNSLHMHVYTSPASLWSGMSKRVHTWHAAMIGQFHFDYWRISKPNLSLMP